MVPLTHRSVEKSVSHTLSALSRLSPVPAPASPPAADADAVVSANMAVSTRLNTTSPDHRSSSSTTLSPDVPASIYTQQGHKLDHQRDPACFPSSRRRRPRRHTHAHSTSLDDSSTAKAAARHSAASAAPAAVKPRRRRQVHRTKSASDILDNPGLYDDAAVDPYRSDDDGLTDLIDFLRNNPPPPGNFMSMPDHASRDERGRWLLTWATRMAKRNSDSSGLAHGSTSGASNSNSLGGSGSSFAVSRRGRSRHQHEPPRILLPDTAVSGTTIGGHRHIAITIPFEACPLRDDRPRSQYPIYMNSPTGNSTNTSYGNNGSSNPVRTVVNDKGVVTILKTVNEDNEPSSDLVPRRSHSQSTSLPSSRAGGRSGINGFVSSPSSARARSSPRLGGDDAPGPRAARVGPSSAVAGGHQQHSSIDGLLGASQQPSAAKAKPASSAGPKSDWSLLDDKAWLARIQTGTPKDSGNKDVVSSESGATVMKENPLGPRKPQEGAAGNTPSRTDSVQSRRDRVRDRKRRDIEAVRAGDRPKPDAGAHANVPTFSPIRTVMNFEPCATPPAEPASETKRGDDDEARRLSAGTAVTHEPTPPHSPDATPPMRQGSVADRTSLQRRREWRERRSSTSPPPPATVPAPAEPEQNIDKEILRLYEAYREHRFRDMERRVRRLERNGDVWLRALIPVLENLNRSYTISSGPVRHDEPQQQPRSAAPRTKHGMTPATAGSAPPVRPGRMPMRADGIISPPTTAEDESPAYNWRDSTGSSSTTHDNEMSGLDTIEPLMRELAGAAKLRQMKTGRSVLEAF